MIGWTKFVTSAALLASVLAAGAQAQCAHTRASPVKGKTEVIGGVACGGTAVAFGGARVNIAQAGCPAMIVSWPPYHEEVDAGSAETQTQKRAMLAPKIAYFECVQHYFLLIPIGSSCVLRRVADGPAFVDLMTVGCG